MLSKLIHYFSSIISPPGINDFNNNKLLNKTLLITQSMFLYILKQPILTKSKMIILDS